MAVDRGRSLRTELPRGGEIAVLGLGRSGIAGARLLKHHGYRVYVSDAEGGDAQRAAATALSAAGVATDVGRHDLDRIARAALIVASPGIPPESAPLSRAQSSAVPVISEIELALHFLTDVQYIAVTGTNGKTTTTALIAHLLRALGRSAIAGGNIGTPLAEIALAEDRPDWIALEISSFQLHDTPSIDPDVGVLTNLTPDHLDRYPSVDAYYGDKARLFSNAGADSRWVVSDDDGTVADIVNGVAGRIYGFSTIHVADGWYDRTRAALVVLGADLMPRGDLSLLGDHNVGNVLAAVLATMLGDPSHATAEARERIAEGVRTFEALPHRLETVGEFEGVVWINDSKATNVSSTLVALNGMRRPTLLLLGGRHKGEPYTALAEPIRRTVKKIIAYGEAAPIIARDLDGSAEISVLGKDFAEVVAAARESASPGDAVLLSPACSSYDMFRNYEERGAVFRALARDVT
jgi:UDP-N-acetylmuramoylalanine--D-glutamate ligase